LLSSGESTGISREHDASIPASKHKTFSGVLGVVARKIQLFITTAVIHKSGKQNAHSKSRDSAVGVLVDNVYGLDDQFESR
jgi:hypothetical protein